MTEGEPDVAPANVWAGRWLVAQNGVAGRAAHELKNSLNGVAVNLAVVQGRLLREQAPESLTRFADAAIAQLDVLTAQVDALLALTRAPRAPLDVGVVASQLATLSGRSLAVTAPPDGGARTASDPTAVRVLLAAVAAAAIDSATGYECAVTTGDGGTVDITVRSGDHSMTAGREIDQLAASAGVAARRPSEAELVLTFAPAPNAPAA